MQNSSQSELIVVFGAPGAGKTTFSLRYAEFLKVGTIINSDLIRDYAAINNKKNLLLNTCSHSAWQYFSTLSEANIIRGFRAHNQAVWEHLSPLLDLQINKYKIVLLEGVHFDDQIYQLLETKGYKKYYLFLELNKERLEEIYRLKSMQRTNNDNPWFVKRNYIFHIDRFLKNVADSIPGYESEFSFNNIYLSNLKKSFIEDQYRNFNKFTNEEKCI